MRPEKGPKIGRELRYAFDQWKDLQKEVDGFLRIPEVQRALADDAFRLGEFRRPWKVAPTTVNVQLISKSYDGQPIKDLATLASALRSISNQTQKLLAKRSAQDGMRETTRIQENMNLLLQGNTLRGGYEVLDFAIPDTVRTIENLRIHAVMAMEVNLRVTKGDLDPEAKDRLVTKTHGLYVISSHSDPRIQLPHFNMVGTADELWNGYSYGRDLDTQKITDRIQGAEFRCMQMREFGNQMLGDIAGTYGWRKPMGRIFTTVIGSEVCTEAALRSGTVPTFGEGQWGIGPKANAGESINFSRGRVREQILRGIPLITETLLHYPKDNPVLRSSK